MSFELNLPNFQVQTASERKLYAYLYQTVQQLNWAMKHLQTVEAAGKIGDYPQFSTKNDKISKTPMETFSEIKSLIIKSTEIVNSYYDSINAKLEGVYLARSEFGDYAQATRLELEANAKGIQQSYANLQGLQTNLEGSVSGLSDRISGLQGDVGSVCAAVDGVKGDVEHVQGTLSTLKAGVEALNTAFVETNAYIRTGVIGEDEHGIPIYGLEIGQTNEVNGREIFNKYARFSSSRLSFYDQNDTEVAYISDYKLYITNVHVTGTLTMGNYEIDTSDGLAFRWIGGEG